MTRLGKELVWINYTTSFHWLLQMIIIILFVAKYIWVSYSMARWEGVILVELKACKSMIHLTMVRFVSSDKTHNIFPLGIILLQQMCQHKTIKEASK